MFIYFEDKYLSGKWFIICTPNLFFFFEGDGGSAQSIVSTSMLVYSEKTLYWHHLKTKRFFCANYFCLSSTSNSLSSNLRQAAGRFGFQRTGSSPVSKKKWENTVWAECFMFLTKRKLQAQIHAPWKKLCSKETQRPLEEESAYWLCEKNHFSDIHGEDK